MICRIRTLYIYTVIDATAYVLYIKWILFRSYYTCIFTLCPINQFAYAYLLASECINWSLYNHDQQAMIIINFQGVVIMICCVYYLCLMGLNGISWQMFLSQMNWTSETAVFGLMRFTVTILWTCFKKVLVMVWYSAFEFFMVMLTVSEAEPQRNRSRSK